MISNKNKRIKTRVNVKETRGFQDYKSGEKAQFIVKNRDTSEGIYYHEITSYEEDKAPC